MPRWVGHVVAQPHHVHPAVDQVQPGAKRELHHLVEQRAGIVLVRDHVAQRVLHAVQVPRRFEDRALAGADDELFRAVPPYRRPDRRVPGVVVRVGNPVGGELLAVRVAAERAVHDLGVRPGEVFHVPERDAERTGVDRVRRPVVAQLDSDGRLDQIVPHHAAQVLLRAAVDRPEQLRDLRGVGGADRRAVRRLMGQGHQRALSGSHEGSSL